MTCDFGSQTFDVELEIFEFSARDTEFRGSKTQLVDTDLLIFVAKDEPSSVEFMRKVFPNIQPVLPPETIKICIENQIGKKTNEEISRFCIEHGFLLHRFSIVSNHKKCRTLFDEFVRQILIRRKPELAIKNKGGCCSSCS